MNDSEDTNLTNTTAIIEAFGGIRPMANKLDVPVSTVQGWKQRDTIPENRAADIVAAARSHNVDLSGIGEHFEPDEDKKSDAAEHAVAPPPTSESPVIERARGGLNSDRSAFAIAVLALIVAVGVGGWMALGDSGQGNNLVVQGEVAEIADRLSTLETTVKSDDSDTAQRQFADDLADLRAELARIARGLNDISASSPEMGDFDSRLQATEAKLGQVQRQAASDAQAAAAALSAARDELGQMRQQLDAVGDTGSSSSQDVTQAVALALAAGRLRRAMDSGAPYQDILVNLRAISAGDAALSAVLDQLAGTAATGTPTRDSLVQTFAGVAREIIAAADIQTAAGWTDRTLQRLRSVASIRRIGADVQGDEPDARVARAEAKLIGGDFAGAVAQLDGLTGAAAAAAASWLGGARARLDADAAVDEVEALAIVRLQSGSGGS